MKIGLFVNTVFAGNAIKGKIVFHSVKSAYLKGYLKRVVVADYEVSIVDKNIIKMALPFCKMVNRAFFYTNKISPIDLPMRFINDKTFDFFSSRFVKGLDLLYFQGPFWSKSFSKADKTA